MLLSDLQILLFSSSVSPLATESYQSSLWKGAELCSQILPKKRKEKTSPMAAQQHKSRRKKTYDEHISGTVDEAFIGTARSLGEKLSICGYTLWHMMSSFVALGWANQQHWGELLLCSALKQPRDGGGVGVGQQCSLPSLCSSTQSCRPGSLWGHVQTPCCPAGLSGKAAVLPTRARPTGGAKNVLPNMCTPMRVTTACCSKAKPSLKSFSWLPLMA